MLVSSLSAMRGDQVKSVRFGMAQQVERARLFFKNLSKLVWAQRTMSWPREVDFVMSPAASLRTTWLVASS